MGGRGGGQEQRLRLGPEPKGPWRELEQPGEDAERMILCPPVAGVDLGGCVLALPKPGPICSLLQEATRAQVPLRLQQPTPRNQRSMSSAEFTQKP